MEGIDQPGQINQEMVRRLKTGRSGSHEVAYYVKGIAEGNRTILSQAITLVESSLPRHKEKADAIISACLQSRQPACRRGRSAVGSPPAGEAGQQSNKKIPDQHNNPASSIQHPASSFRVGITGVPGVGKSTFIEALGTYLTGKGHKIAVLAIDPSSSRSKGSILGDKTRMEELAVDPNAFIRPSPSAGSLGGVARKTRETIILCEAAGFDVVFVETVGVGQSETAVHSMVDFFLLLMLAGAGDELQGIKRGIIEMADAIIINKADGDNIRKAQMAQAEYANALHLYPPPENGWTPETGICSAQTKAGIEPVWDMIVRHHLLLEKNGQLSRMRYDQNLQVFRETIEEGLREHFFSSTEVARLISRTHSEIVQGAVTPYAAAKEVLDSYFRKP
jgi:LAO/AO transport system kinase